MKLFPKRTGGWLIWIFFRQPGSLCGFPEVYRIADGSSEWIMVSRIFTGNSEEGL
jgi:hypothetical protein